ncbi:hypothetical protein ACFWN2_08545 [Lentzea sp. NPDC058436]|uniref:hypothetical protein n=1 Tax=Lentzea sp. NPDC058436 TaxID=3346499 RepID=UPI0036594B18
MAEGRDLVKDGAGDRWAAAVRLRVAKSVVSQTLKVEDVDRSLWDVPVPDGYRVAAWAGAATEDLVATYA